MIPPTMIEAGARAIRWPGITDAGREMLARVVLDASGIGELIEAASAVLNTAQVDQYTMRLSRAVEKAKGGGA